MKKTIAFVFVAVMIVLAGFGQAGTSPGLQTVVPASPNAAALGKYGELPVGMYTGIPNISIPLYTLKDRELEVPISLSYHAGGVRVEEIASWAGIGWSLNAGGAITRSIRGMPDDYNGGYFGAVANITALSKKYMGLPPDQANSFDLSDGNCQAADLNAIGGILGGTSDGQADIFYFNFGKYSGSFFMNESGQFVVSPLQALTVQKAYSSANNGHLTQWILTTPDGVQYIFGTSADGTRTAWENNDNGSMWGVSTTGWYLLDIISPHNDKISLTYTNVSYSYSTRASEVLNQIVSETGGNGASNLTFDDKKITINNMTVPRLVSITSANGTVTFGAGANRTDLPGEKALASVNIYNNQNLTTPIKSWLFNTDYYTNRLTLETLREFSGDGSLQGQTYSFSYNPPLPNSDPNSSSINSQDLWGYYNGVANQYFPQGFTVTSSQLGTIAINGADRHSDSTYMQYGALHKITFPTGGYTQLDYEPNQVYTTSGDNSIPPLPVSHEVGQAYFYNTSFSDTFTVVYANPATGNVAITVTALSMLNTCPFDNNGFSQCYYATLKGINGNSFPLTDWKNGTTNTTLLPGTYVLTGTGAGTGGNLGDQTGNLFRLYLDWTEYPPPVTNPNQMVNKNIGGLRIKRMTNFDGISTNITKYLYNSFSNTSASSGVLVNEPFNYANTFKEDIIMGNIIETTIYLQVKGTPLIPLMPTQGAAIGYQNVTKLIGENGENGKEEYTYTTANDYPDQIQVYRPYPPNCSFDWRRGQLLKTTTYKNNSGSFVPIQVKSNHYLNSIKQSVAYGMSMDNDATHLSGSGGQVASSPVDYYVGPFRTIAEFQYLQSDTIVTFDQNNPSAYIQTVHNYTYDTVQGHYQKTSEITTDSKGHVEETDYKYPQDVTLSGYEETARQNLIAAFILTPVLETKKLRNGLQMTDTKNNYMVFGNGFALPQSIDVQTTTYPVDRRIEYLRYDTYGNLVQQHKENDVLNTYIWDYNQSYPIASVLGSDSVNIAYTSFEADGSGTWTIPSASRDTGGITGGSCYNLSSGNITRSGLTAATSYVISFWARTTSSVTVTGGTGAVVGKTIGGWTYHEYALSGATSATVSGTGDIDELRLYPSSAQMTTYTYTPLVGTTTQADVDNRATYYEYDGLTRLADVKDQDRNVVKRYCYNYSGQTTNCTLTNYPVGVIVTNNSTAATYVNFTNTITQQSYSFSAAAGISAVQIGQVPPGTYTVSIGQQPFNASSFISYTIGTNTQTNCYQVNFSNIVVNAPVNIVMNHIASVAVNAANGTNENVTMSFAGTLGTYPFSTLPGNNGVAGYIPVGKYSVTFQPSSTVNTYPINYTVNGSTVMNWQAQSFSNVNGNSAVTVSAIAPASVPVSVQNTTNQTITSIFTNSFGGSIAITAAPGFSGTAGYVPQVVYTVTMAPPAPASLTYPIIFTANGSTQTYPGSVTYSNFSLNGSASLIAAPVPTVAVNSADGTIKNITETFTNSWGGQINFSAAPGNNGLSGNIPQGAYNLTITPSSPSSTYPIQWSYNGSIQYYYNAVTYANLSITGAVSISANVPPNISVVASNSGSKAITIWLVDVNSGQQYGNYTSASGTSNLTLATIPAGQYQVFVSPGTGNTTTFVYTVNGTSLTSTGMEEFGGTYTGTININIAP